MSSFDTKYNIEDFNTLPFSLLKKEHFGIEWGICVGGNGYSDGQKCIWIFKTYVDDSENTPDILSQYLYPIPEFISYLLDYYYDRGINDKLTEIKRVLSLDKYIKQHD